jgi:hypothetical protein
MMRSLRARDCLLILLLGAAAQASAQGVRGSVSALGRRVEIRGVRLDSVEAGLVTIAADSTRSFEGLPVNCGTTQCTFYRPGPAESAVFFTQDIDLVAWGLGLPGLSATALLRTRQNALGDFQWPRADDAFDAILAYAEWNREWLRLRGGRQRIASGLGFTGFDGLEAQMLPRANLRVQLFGGRSLARGLEDARNSALLALDDFLPDQTAYLLGGATQLYWARASIDVRYQREIWSDRHGLISERAALDARTPLRANVELEISGDYDFAFGRIGKAHLTTHWNARPGRLIVDATARRYVPYFELWTIWGFFSPVAYHEAELQASWRMSPDRDLSAAAAFRKYQDADAPIVFGPLEDDVVRLQLRGRERLNRTLVLTGEYRIERGFGAFLSSGDAGVAWSRGDRLRAELHASAAQQILEFRLGEGALLGVGGSADFELSDNVGVSGGLDLYRHVFQNRPSMLDWNQARIWLGARFDFGSDPGMRGDR